MIVTQRGCAVVADLVIPLVVGGRFGELDDGIVGRALLVVDRRRDRDRIAGDGIGTDGTIDMSQLLDVEVDFLGQSAASPKFTENVQLPPEATVSSSPRGAARPT